MDCVALLPAPDKIDDLVPESLAAVAVHQEVERFKVTGIPLAGGFGATCLVAQYLTVQVEQCDKDCDDADRVDRDENARDHGVGLIFTGVAIDGEASPIKQKLWLDQRGTVCHRLKLDSNKGNVLVPSLVLVILLARVEVLAGKTLKSSTAEKSIDL